MRGWRLGGSATTLFCCVLFYFFTIFYYLLFTKKSSSAVRGEERAEVYQRVHSRNRISWLLSRSFHSSRFVCHWDIVCEERNEMKRYACAQQQPRMLDFFALSGRLVRQQHTQQCRRREEKKKKDFFLFFSPLPIKIIDDDEQCSFVHLVLCSFLFIWTHLFLLLLLQSYYRSSCWLSIHSYLLHHINP